MTDDRVRESDEVSGHMWRLAQTNRLRRYCEARGVDAEAVMAGRTDLDLSPICDHGGKIMPEPVDIDAARR